MTTATQTPEALMEQLLSGTNASVETMRTNAERDLGLDAIFGQAEKMYQQVPLATSKLDANSAQVIEEARGVQRANYATCKANIQKQEIDVRQAMLNLATIVEVMDVQVKTFKEPTVEEKASLEAAAKAIDAAKLELAIAQQKNWLLRKGAVTRATMLLEASQKSEVELQKSVARAIDDRLKTTTMEQNLNRFISIASSIIDAMQKGAVKVNAQEQLVKASQAKAAQAKVDISTILTKTDAELEIKEADLLREKETLTTIPNGTAEYSTQEAKIGLLEGEIIQLRGKHNMAQALFQEKELEVEELKVIERALINLKVNFGTWKVMLESQSNKRNVMWRAALEVMRGGQTQSAAKDVNNVGRKIDHDFVVRVAEVDVASQRAINETLTGIPVHLDGIFKISDAHDQQMAEFTKELGELYGQMKQHYPNIQRLNFVDAKPEEAAATGSGLFPGFE